MKSKIREKLQDQESALSQFFGPPDGDRPQPPPCAHKMGIADAYIEVQVRVFGRHRLIFEFRRAAIHEGFFGKRHYHLAGRKLVRYLGLLTELIHEQFVRVLRDIFGWYLEPRRPRQEQLIFILPKESIAPQSHNESNGDPVPSSKPAGEDPQ